MKRMASMDQALFSRRTATAIYAYLWTRGGELYGRGRTVEPLMLFIATMHGEVPNSIVATWPLLKAMRNRYWLQNNPCWSLP